MERDLVRPSTWLAMGLALGLSGAPALAEDNAASMDVLDELFSQPAEPEPGAPPAEPTAEPVDESPESTATAEEPLPTIPVAPSEGAPDKLSGPRHAPVALEEIVVTANKRSESLSSVAGAVSAIDKAMLEGAGASGFGDYLSLAPGVNFNAGVPGYSVITIRGVSSDTVPTLAQTAVGVYYDDIPLTDPAAPMVVPDIDAFDARRVEVLRGPQGALYGSASLGGAVNYIPQAPGVSVWEWAAQGSGSLATNSSIGGSGKLMLNAPIVRDALALRLVGHYTRTPGYIDNVGTGEEQANNAVTYGGRAILGWEPSPDASLRLSGLYQKTTIDDAGYVDESLGDLKKDTLVPEPSGNQIRLASLRYEQDAEYGSWAFIAGFQDKTSEIYYDGATSLGVGALGAEMPLIQLGDVSGYSAELRFVSPPDDTFEYLAGLSYADRDEIFDVILDVAALNDVSGGLGAVLEALGIETPDAVGNLTTLFRQNAKIRAPEKAIFLDTTWRFAQNFKLTAGGRYYDNLVDSVIDGRGLLLVPAGSPEFHEARTSEAKGFNPKVSLAWEPTDELMFYGLYSRGYRLGGPNLVPSTPVFVTQRNYDPDEVRNYELGAKTAWFDRRLTFDLAGFYIDWQDIILVSTDGTGTFKYLDNAGNAGIYGVELSMAMRPLEFLSAQTSVTWLDARLRNEYDPGNGRPPAQEGDRLPGSPEWSASNTLTAAWELPTWQPTVTLIHRYEGTSASSLLFQDVTKGGYHLFDLRAGFKRGNFTMTAFAKNLADERGVTASNNYVRATGDVQSLKFITPPRSFGLELGYSFME